MAQNTTIFGVPVSAESYEGNTIGIRFVNASSAFDTLSSNKIMLGGFPVSVFKNSEGKHAIGLHIISSGSSILNYESLEYGSFFNYKGSKFYYKKSGKYNVWAYKLSVGGLEEHTYDIPWYGTTLSLNSNRELLAHVRAGNPDEVQMASVGGIPMPFARFGNEWYLSIINDQYLGLPESEPEPEPELIAPLAISSVFSPGQDLFFIEFNQGMDTTVTPGLETILYSVPFGPDIARVRQATSISWLDNIRLRVLVETQESIAPGVAFPAYYYTPGSGTLRGANGANVGAFIIRATV